MGCKVVEVKLPNGESSNLYRDLSFSMPGARALETYLELNSKKEAFKELYGLNNQGEINPKSFTQSPKFKLVEFKSYQQQVDVMNMLADEFITVLKSKSATASDTTLTGINLEGLTSDPMVIPEVIKQVRQNLIDDIYLYNNEGLTAEDIKTIENAAINLPGYLGAAGQLGPLGAVLNDYGISIKVSDKFTEVESYSQELEQREGLVDLESKEIEYERIYDMDLLETSAANSILEQVKIYLRSTKRVDSTYKFSERNPVPEYEYSSLGDPRPARYELLVSKMFGILKGMKNADEMADRIKKALKSSPELTPIYNDLINEKPVILSDGTSYKPIASALFTTFSKQDYNMFTIAERSDGSIIFTDSNASSVQNKVKGRWREDLQQSHKAYKTRKGIKTKERLLKRVDLLLNPVINGKKTPLAFDKTLNASTGPNNITLGKVAKLFQDAGYTNVIKEDIVELINYVQANPRVYKKGRVNQAIKPSSIVRTYINALVKRSVEGKDVFISTSEDYGEKRSLNVLSNVVSMRVNDIHSGAFRSSRGTMIHPINNSSEAQDIWGRISTSKETMQLFADDPMYTNTKILEVIAGNEHASMFDVRTLDVLNDNTRRNSGRTFGKLSTFDALASRANAYFASLGDKKYFYAFSPTQADRGNLQALVVPKINTDNLGKDLAVFSKGKLVDGEIKDWLTDRVQAEVIRIAKINTGKTPYKAYGKNGKKFNFMEGLNTLPIQDIKNTPQSIAKFTNMAMQKIDEEGLFKSIIEQDAQFYIDNGLFTIQDGVFKPTTEGKKGLSKDLGARKVLTQDQMDNFLANNYAYSYEQTLFYIGDPAYYKASSTKAQKVDMNKRFGLPFTPGVRLSVGKNLGIGETAKIKILKEGNYPSPMADVYNEILGDTTSKMFKSIEHADGQGYVSLKRYKQLMLSRGLHSDALIKLISDLQNWKQGDKAIQSDVSLEALKAFYFRLQKSKDGSVVPFNLKYSILPVIPSLFEAKQDGKYKHPVMAKISKELKSGRADEVVMESAVKVGGAHASDITTLESAEATTIFNESVRFPQVSPSYKKIEDTFGSQIRSLIIGNYNSSSELDLAAGVINSDDALVLYDDAIKTLVETGGDEVYNEFVNEGKINKPALVARLLKDVQNNTFNNAEYYQEALNIIEGAEKSLLPLSYPTIKYKLDNIINAAFRNKVNKLKLPGYSAVQISSYGMADKSQIDTGSDLKFVAFNDLDGNRVSIAKAMELAKKIKTSKGLAEVVENYTVAPAEIRVTPKFFEGVLKKVATQLSPNIRKSIDKKVKEFAEIIPDNLPESEINDALNNYRNLEIHKAGEQEFKRLKGIITDSKGNYKIKEIRDAGLDKVVLYRIPTQGKNSMLPAQIYDFMPNELGGTVQLPAEIVDQAGSDFDIDKVHVEMSNFDVVDNKLVKQSYLAENSNEVDVSSEASAKEYIVDFHRAVLSSPDYIADLLLPNSTKTLGNIADAYGVNDIDIGEWASAKTQESLRINNKAGKEMISISSIASVAHSNAKHIGAHFIKPVFIGDSKRLILGQDTNRDGVLISTEIAEIQNAAVDNARDPLLGKLNIDEFTSPVALLLVSGGYGLKFATDAINSPIVKKLASIYPKYTRKYSRSEALRLATNEVRREFKTKSIKKSTIKNVYSLATYDKNMAAKLKDGTSVQDHAVALEAFLDLKEIGDQLTSFQQAMRFNAVPSSVAALIDKYNTVAGIPGTHAYNQEVKSKALQKRKERKTAQVYTSRDAMFKAMKDTSSKIARTADEKNYRNIKTGKLYTRLTEYIGNSIDTSELSQSRLELIEASKKVGNVVDNIVRDFFTTGKVLPNTAISDKALQKITDRLDAIKQHFKNTGEKVITDPKALLVYDDVLEVAGEQDLITIDDNKVFRIYDVKTAAKTKPAHYKDKTYGSNILMERFIKRGKQLNGYRALNRNTNGIIAADLNIIEFHTIYNNDGSYIEDIGSSDKMFENHKIDDSILRDTRVVDDNKAERMLDKLGKTPRLSPIAVRTDKYNSSHISTLEKYTLGKPLEVQRMSSPSASIQAQRVLTAIGDSILGNLDENQQTKILAAYDSYLALNAKSTVTSKSSMANEFTGEDVLRLTDSTSPDSTSFLLKAYRKYVQENNLAENQFTENLSIVNKEGRAFVTFNNSIAKSLTGEAKKSMMFFFEDLMYSKNPIEYKLAKSLADYAMLHYGYERSINSFMDFLPPQAHTEYMKGSEGNNMAEHFRVLGDTFDATDRFNGSAESFATMYVQNNADNLNLRRAEFGALDWKMKIMEEAMFTNTAPPKFVLTEGVGGKTNLFKLNGNSYSKIEKRGIPNFMIEYQEGLSLVNDKVSTTDMDSKAAQNRASEENKDVIKSIADKKGIKSFANAVNAVQPLNSMQFNSETQAISYMKDVIKSVSSELSTAEVEVLTKQLIVVGVNSAKRRVKANLESSFDAAYKNTLEKTIFPNIDEMRVSARDKKIIDKIKTCE